MSNNNYKYLVENLHGFKKELVELEDRKDKLTDDIEEVKIKIKKEKEMMAHFRDYLEETNSPNCTF